MAIVNKTQVSSTKTHPTSTDRSKFVNANEFTVKGLQISLASPEYIRSLSKGEVTTFETINYKSLKPEKNGLFCEAIFGPIKDYECSCGKYKQVKYKGKRCEKCKVCITQSLVRRDWMGHIELACPVAHIWMIKELPLPAKISLILGIKYKNVEEVVYFNNYIVLDSGTSQVEDKPLFNELEIIDVSGSKASAPSLAKLRSLLRNIYEGISKENPTNYHMNMDYQQGRAYYKALTNSNLPFSIMDMFEYLEKHTGLRVGIGAEAIYELLKKIDLESLEFKLTKELNASSQINYSDPKVRKILARLQVVRWFRESGNRPEWMILKVIPVIPPNLRPIIQLEGGRFTASDINTFYRRIIVRNDRLARILKLNVAHIIANNEKRMLQEAVDSLIDNAGRKKPLTAKDKHPLKSITDHLKGKQGLFRQNLLGKRVDYSGRSVIVVGPELKMYQVGLPILLILSLFKPFIIGELIRKVDDLGNECMPIAPNIKTAAKMISEQSDEIWPVVHKVIKERPVLLNRAPTLHRLGIQAFEPILVEGKAICLHPLVTTAFNADFDGDQMAVHLPLSKEAIHEARSVLLAPWQVLGPKDSKPIVTPSQDMVLGIYHLTTEDKSGKGSGTMFATPLEAIVAYQMEKVELHSVVFIPTSSFPQRKFPKSGVMMTTIGKIIFNQILPDTYKYVTESKNMSVSENDILTGPVDRESALASYVDKDPFDKGVISSLIEDLHDNYTCVELAPVLDEIKNLGFEYSTHSCTTISAFDVPQFTEKYALIEEADLEVEKQKQYLKKGLITNDEKYKNVVSIWSKVKDKVSDHIKTALNSAEFKNNPIIIMARSGARGNISNFIQLSGMRGLMNRSYNYDQNLDAKVIHDIIEVPIKRSFIEGLTVIEYFNSSYGARKGMTDTAMKTSKSGYMTRKLVDAAQEVIVKSEDCGCNKGLFIEAIIDDAQNFPIKTLQERIMYKCAYTDIVHPETGEIIVAANEPITADLANKVAEAGITRVQVRSVLHCRQQQGVCQRCFGFDLTTKKLIDVGAAVGVISAQSVGEPAIQLTMRTFHSGGVAGEANITQGFERLKRLLEIVTPKKWEQSVISEIAGIVHNIEITEGEKVITVKNDIDTREYAIDLNLPVLVEVGQRVELGQRLCDGCVDLKKLLEVLGIDAVRSYIVQEVQKVYWIQGIDISEKYIEIIVRQLTSKMKVLSPNDSKWVMNEIVDYTVFVQECTKLLLDNKTPPIGVNIIFGLEEAPEKTNSFLAAASFQDTKKILTDASVKGQIDYLRSLKENIMVGNLIPAGTGLKTPDEIVTDPNSFSSLFNY
ncbi:DNA-directed RNA polymerase subunit beta' [Candidatus Mycoplasma haematohominis]|uniref:DNA-directed RNA polymerase subunit beta' n=1 Tax=Candidatus Mycoplasma haematohominis TaxID=1494318 RepID=A0A478FQV5_9MOLU|nr:DNA-directed RNA polymerase subunit beta' [Candidatus Mycoplasma haemohominis]